MDITKKEKLEICITDLEDFKTHLFECEYANASVKKYVTDIETFCHYLGKYSIIQKIDLIKYKEWLIDHYANSSVNSMLVSLNQFLSFMGYSKWKLKRLKVQKQLFTEKDRVLSQSDYQKLIHVAQSSGKEQLALIIETIGSTGIRISELRFFTIEMIQKGKIDIHNKGKFRTILIPKELRKKLLVYASMKKIDSGVLFCTRSGKAKDRSNIWKEMRKLSESCSVNCEKIYPHNIRHLFARNFYKVNKSLINLADILGHSSMEVTRVYTKDCSDKHQKLLDHMYNVFKNKTSINSIKVT